MKKIANKKVIYYKSYNDDVVESKNQNYKIKDNYKWINKNVFYNLLSKFLFNIIGRAFSFIYCKMILHVKVENKKILNKFKDKGYFIYGNHTQPVGDAFIPFRVLNKRFYTIASQANLGIPIIGKILPIGGAIIIPEKISQTKIFMKVVETRINEKNAVVIYPEGHVWPYYTKIRPFQTSAFKFPVKNNVPSFCMTVTYYKRKNKNKPGIKIYVDGPFMPDQKLSAKKMENDLCNRIHNKMVERSKNSDYEYIIYKGEN